MTKLACNVPCTIGGTTLVVLNFECQRSGGSNDRAAFRIIRRVAGQGDVILPTAPQFVLSNDRDVRCWQFIDVGVPVTGDVSYVVQIMRINGAGNFFAIQISGVHCRR